MLWTPCVVEGDGNENRRKLSELLLVSIWNCNNTTSRIIGIIFTFSFEGCDSKDYKRCLHKIYLRQMPSCSCCWYVDFDMKINLRVVVNVQFLSLTKCFPVQNELSGFVGPTEALPDYARIRGDMYWLRT